jgi:hypothetical protein
MARYHRAQGAQAMAEHQTAAAAALKLGAAPRQKRLGAACQAGTAQAADGVG